MLEKGAFCILVFALLLASLGAQAAPTSPAVKIKLTKLKEFDGFWDSVFSRDGTKVALSGVRNKFVHRPSIRIVSVPSGKQICDVEIPESEYVFPDSFSPDGQELAVHYSVYNPVTGHNTGTIVLIDAKNCQRTRVLASDRSPGSDAMAYHSPDGSYVVGQLNSIRIWDRRSGDEKFRLDLPDGFLSTDSLLSPDGKWLVSHAEKFIPSGGKKHLVVAFNTETRELTRLDTDREASFSFSDDSKKLYSDQVGPNFSAYNPNPEIKVKVYEIGTWKVERTYEDPSLGNIKWNDENPEFSKNFTVSTKSNLMAFGSNDGRFRVFSLVSGQKVAEGTYSNRSLWDDIRDSLLEDPPTGPYVGRLSFSPDGTMLLIGGSREKTQLWRIVQNSVNAGK